MNVECMDYGWSVQIRIPEFEDYYQRGLSQLVPFVTLRSSISNAVSEIEKSGRLS